MGQIADLAKPLSPIFILPRRARRWTRFAQSTPAVCGLIWLIILSVFTIFGSRLSPYDIFNYNLADAYQGPSLQHWFGTNNIGQDMLSLVIDSIRDSVLIGLGATGIALAIGTAVGMVSGLRGGLIDAVLMRVTDFMYAFPTFFFTMFLTMDFGHGLPVVIFAIGVAQWAGFARLIRGMVLQQRDTDMVESGRAIGASPFRIALWYVLPHVMTGLLVYTAFSIANMMTQEIMLDMMGAGVAPPAMSLGSLMADGAQNAMGFQWLLLYPTLVYAVTMLSLVLTADGLQRALHPKAMV